MKILRLIIGIPCSLVALASALYLCTWVSSFECPQDEDWGKFGLALLVFAVSATIGKLATDDGNKVEDWELP